MMTSNLPPGIHRATCHCGGVELQLTLPDGLESPRRCTCSYCSRRGAVAVSVLLENLAVTRGDTLRLYTFNTGAAKHYFCGTCGNYTHHQRRSNPHQFGVNAACIEGVQVWDLGEIPWADGVNHPSDRT